MFFNPSYIYILEVNKTTQVVLTQEEKEILKRMLKYEETHNSEWEWWQVGVHPAKIIKLVNKGLVEIVGKGKGLKYKLVDKDLIRRVTQ
jgi:ribosomal protein L22